MQGKVTVVAYHRAKTGTKRALRDALLAVCAPARAEKGCINCDNYASPDDPRGLVFHENCTSKADLDDDMGFKLGQGGSAWKKAPPRVGSRS